mmetsp:Transcript_79993/g.141156  ORF Transcript_79993/g.141156 Transcript_79993/m.141156 type:complete len:535 (-) Transcript_79993:207-1811(-)
MPTITGWATNLAPQRGLSKQRSDNRPSSAFTGRKAPTSAALSGNGRSNPSSPTAWASRVIPRQGEHVDGHRLGGASGTVRSASLGRTSSDPSSPSSTSASPSRANSKGRQDRRLDQRRLRRQGEDLPQQHSGLREPDPLSSMTTLHGLSPAASHPGLQNRSSATGLLKWNSKGSGRIQPDMSATPDEVETHEAWQARVLSPDFLDLDDHKKDNFDRLSVSSSQENQGESSRSPTKRPNVPAGEETGLATVAMAQTRQLPNSSPSKRDQPVSVLPSSSSTTTVITTATTAWAEKSGQSAEDKAKSGGKKRSKEAPRENPVTLPELAQELKIPFQTLQEAAETFKRFADDPSNPDVFQRRLSMANFQGVLEYLCAGADDVSPDFMQTAFYCADRDESGAIDIREFGIWYSSFSFSEEFALDKDARQLRTLAKQLNLDIVAVDKYKRAYDKFDTDGSGAIELDEFTALLHALLKVPDGSIPDKRVMSLWRQADSDGAGELDFGKFCAFYKCTFDDAARAEGSDPFTDFYRNIRRVPG